MSAYAACISDEYDNSENDEVYGFFAFVEDEQIGEFAKELDVTRYLKLDWKKATLWFKEIVTVFGSLKSSFGQSFIASQVFQRMW
jgi:hypothetical protein